MQSLSDHSRRALFATAAALAAAPLASASAKKKKGKKKKPPAPLAFAAVSLSANVFLGETFIIVFDGVVHDPAALNVLDLEGEVEAPYDGAIAALISQVQQTAATRLLEGNGVSVPADRIAVITI